MYGSNKTLYDWNESELNDTVLLIQRHRQETATENSNAALSFPYLLQITLICIDQNESGIFNKQRVKQKNKGSFIWHMYHVIHLISSIQYA